MAKTTWGRKETIVWPRHMPIYTYGVVFAAVALTFVFLCVRLRFGTTPLQRYYLPVYERTSVVGSLIVTHRDTYRILFVAGRGVPMRPAMDGDVVLGKTPELGGKAIPLALSQATRQHGYTLLFRGPQRSYVDVLLTAYLKGAVYGGSSLSAVFRPPLLGGILVFVVLLPFAVRKDVERQKQLKYGRRLKGPEMLTPQQFNRIVKGDEIGRAHV